MAKLDASKRASLPDSAFAYVDSQGRRRLPINDEAHVRNALARFNQVSFESETARSRARRRLLNAAKKYGIVPVGFISGQIESEQEHAAAGRMVIELGKVGAPGELEQSLRTALNDSTLTVLYWSDAAGSYLDGSGKSVALPVPGKRKAVSFLERNGRPLSVLVHDPVLRERGDLTQTVMAAVRFVIEKESLLSQIHASSTDAARLPTGFVTLMMTDIESSTSLLHDLGEVYATLLNGVRGVVRRCVLAEGGREIDARADEFFAVFEEASRALSAAIEINRELRRTSWPRDVEVRLRIGLHSGRPSLTDVGYIGMAVHTTARVCGVARGGEIVVSGDTKTAVGEAPGVRFGHLGARRLAGLTEMHNLFRVEVDR
ncbi:MAG: DUF6582 domain-containing protein [Actinomycetota bacterium]